MPGGTETAHSTGGRETETARNAVLLGWVAGGVDAIGYLVLGHLFVAHMSGNSATLGASVSQGAWGTVVERGGVILLFGVGIALGTILGEIGRRRGGRHPFAAIYGLEIPLLVSFWLLGRGFLTDGEIHTSTPWQLYGLAALPILAMGLQSAGLRRVGGHGLRTTYISGVITSLAESLARAGLKRWRREPGGSEGEAATIRLFAGVFLAYLGGAVLGGVGLQLWGLASLGLPIAVLVIALVRDLRHPHELGEDRPAS
jgi:uncharacterized membrane protein YoaK (UPF0700 family)